MTEAEKRGTETLEQTIDRLTSEGITLAYERNQALRERDEARAELVRVRSKLEQAMQAIDQTREALDPFYPS